MTDTVKFSTFLWIVVGLLCLYADEPAVVLVSGVPLLQGRNTPRRPLSELQAAVELHKSGNLTDAELQQVKTKVLGGKSA